MRNALPNASYMGFTGTPLFKDDEITKKIFGEYVSTYDFQRAVEDKATVPLYYDARGDKLGIETNELNERIAQKLEELDAEIEDENKRQRLEREIKGEDSHPHCEQSASTRWREISSSIIPPPGKAAKP